MPGSTLSVWAFDTSDGVERAVRALEELQRENPSVVLDHATVIWDQGKKKPTARQGSRSGSAAFDGSFWGMLFGLIFFVPLLASAVGTASGGFAGSMADVGIDDRFVTRLRTRVTPGTSALFLMTSRAVLDRVRDLFSADGSSELIYTRISEEQDSALHRVFGGGPTASRRRRRPARVQPSEDAAVDSVTPAIERALSSVVPLHPVGSPVPHDLETAGPPVPSLRSVPSGSSRQRKEAP
jgi:uncharacterized membrane protein